MLGAFVVFLNMFMYAWAENSKRIMLAEYAKTLIFLEYSLHNECKFLLHVKRQSERNICNFSGNIFQFRIEIFCRLLTSDVI